MIGASVEKMEVNHPISDLYLKFLWFELNKNEKDARNHRDSTECKKKM